MRKPDLPKKTEFGRLFAGQLIKLTAVSDLFQLGGFVGAALDLASPDAQGTRHPVVIGVDVQGSSAIDLVEKYIPSKSPAKLPALCHCESGYLCVSQFPLFQFVCLYDLCLAELEFLGGVQIRTELSDDNEETRRRNQERARRKLHEHDHSAGYRNLGLIADSSRAKHHKPRRGTVRRQRRAQRTARPVSQNRMPSGFLGVRTC